MKNEDTSYCKQSGIINMTDKATYLYDTLSMCYKLLMYYYQSTYVSIIFYFLKILLHK